MAIAFIPVRDQSRVIRGNKDSGVNKGNVLKRLSTGKKISDPRDNVGDYSKVNNMRNELSYYNDAIKKVSLGTSLFEVALSTYQLLNEYYTDLASQLEQLKTAKSNQGTEYVTNGTGKIISNKALSDTDEKYYANLIQGTIDSINNLSNTSFDGTAIVYDETGGGKMSVKFTENGSNTNGYSTVEVNLMQIVSPTAIKNVNGKFLSKTSGETLYHYDIVRVGDNEAALSSTNAIADDDTVDTLEALLTKVKEDFNATGTNDIKSNYKTITSLIAEAKNNANVAMNNYKLLMAGIMNLSNIDRLAQVQKTNTTAAISALEDIDVQEEMMELMQAQILEELSSEALIKIKESSKYIINLIRA